MLSRAVILNKQTTCGRNGQGFVSRLLCGYLMFGGVLPCFDARGVASQSAGCFLRLDFCILAREYTGLCQANAEVFPAELPDRVLVLDALHSLDQLTSVKNSKESAPNLLVEGPTSHLKQGTEWRTQRHSPRLVPLCPVLTSEQKISFV